MHDQIERILAKLGKAAQLPRPSRQKSQPNDNAGDFFRFFGSDHHGYVLNPPISSGAADEWEKKYRVTLPPEYRVFLEHCGNGGAGPYYGLLPLDRWDDGCNVRTESLKDWPSSPCRLLEHFSPDPDPDAWLVQVGGPDWEARFEAALWAPMVGTLTLCEVGCGGYVYLILNGPLVGRICFSEHLTPPKFWPQRNFLDWYESWLDWVVTGDPQYFQGKASEN